MLRAPLLSLSLLLPMLYFAVGVPANIRNEEPSLKHPYDEDGRPLITLPDPRDHTATDLSAYRIDHYDINVSLDPNRTYFRGHVIIHYFRLSLRTQCLRLDTLGLRVKSVYLLEGDMKGGGGKKIKLERRLEGRRPHLGRPLTIRMRGTPLQGKLLIRYSAVMSNNIAFYHHDDVWLSLTSPFYSRAWFPCADTLGGKARVRMTVTVPVGYTVVGVGRHVSNTTSKTTSTFTSRLDTPVSPYLMAFAMGRFEFTDISPRTRVWYRAPSRKMAERLGRLAVAMMPEVEAVMGPYTWGRYDLVVSPSKFRGMEIPNVNFFLEDMRPTEELPVLVHEMVHSWIGNTMSPRYGADLWIKEGINNYVSSHIMKRRNVSQILEAIGGGIYGEGSYDEFFYSAPEKSNTLKTALSMIAPDLTGFNPRDYLLSSVTYFKSMFFMKEVEMEVGRSRRMIRFIRYLTRKYDTLTTDQFMEEFEGVFPGVGVRWKEWFEEEDPERKYENEVYNRMKEEGLLE